MNTFPDTRRGYFAAATAFILWGLFPLYWKLLGHVPALEIMLHRVLWCFVFVTLLLGLRQGWTWWRPLLRQPKLLLCLAASGSLISINWYLYIWAVTSGHIVEISLGYYINPLVNVAMGTALLGERLKPAQMIAVGLAAIGVVYLTVMNGRFPWIAITLALSFASYGLIRKMTDVGPIAGLALEGATILPFALASLAYLHVHQQAVFGSVSMGTQSLLILGGAVTAIPLILFAYGARRIPYSSLGMLQYMAPTIQLGLGVWVYKEAFNINLLIGFSCIWLALLIYTADGIQRMSRSVARRQQV